MSYLTSINIPARRWSGKIPTLSLALSPSPSPSSLLSFGLFSPSNRTTPLISNFVIILYTWEKDLKTFSHFFLLHVYTCMRFSTDRSLSLLTSASGLRPRTSRNLNSFTRKIWRYGRSNCKQRKETTLCKLLYTPNTRCECSAFL